MDIQATSAGKIIRASTGYKAFVPHPLPPKIEWTPQVLSSLSRADHLLGKLSREGSLLPNPHLFIRPFIAKEAVLSSRIEGTQATLKEILINEIGQTVERNPDDMQEVRNYITALDYALERLKDFPLSLRVICEIHAHLMNGVRGRHATPGEFRRSQNWIGIPGCTLATATFVPPPPHEMHEALSHFEKFLHDRMLPPLIHIALCHYQFEAIHPFLDGNGRIGRLLITLLLIEWKMLTKPLLYLSAFFEATRDEYYRRLFFVSTQGSWNDWLSYFLNGIATQSQDALSRAERIDHHLMDWHKLVGASPLLQNILNQMVANPYVTAKKLVENHKIAFSTAQRAIHKLESLDILKQVSKGKRDRLYASLPILNILEEPTKI